MRIWITIVVLGLFAVSSQAQKIHVETNDGNAQVGSLAGLFSDGLKIKGPNGVNLISWSSILLLNTDENVSVKFGEDEQIHVRLMGVEDDSLIVNSDHLGILKLQLSSLPVAPTETTVPAEGPKTPLEPKDWSGSVTLNGSSTYGNSDTLLVAIDALAAKQWSHDRLETSLRIVYGQTDSEESANSQAFRVRFEHHYSENFYSYAQAEIFRNKIQDITLGALVDVGAGYTLWKDSDKELFSVEGGVGYRLESYEDDTDTRNDVTGRGALVYKDILFGKVELSTLAEIIVPLNEPNAYLGRLQIQWQVPVSENWSFNNAIRFNYRNVPANDAQKLDVFIGAGLKYSF